MSSPSGETPGTAGDLLQLVAATAMESPAGGDPETIKDAQLAVFRAVETAEPAHYVRGQCDGHLDTEGVAPGSTSETYAALRLDVDNWRWSGVPCFGNSIRFTRQDGVEETWRIMQPLLDSPPPVHGYPPGSWGPPAAAEIVAGHSPWHIPWGTP